jgi:hypothetical protein
MNHLGGSGIDNWGDADPAFTEREVCIGAWIGYMNLNESSPEVKEGPVIVIIFPADDHDPNYYAKLMERQYRDHKHLFKRLRAKPQFVFMDLYRMFTR